jgi:hypothetical protein
MTAGIDNTYRTEKLLDWERKSLTGKFSRFSLSDKSTYLSFGLIILVICVFAFIIPFIPPRYGGGNWTPATTSNEYWYRVRNFWRVVPIIIIGVIAYINIRKKIDLSLGIKRTANFKVTGLLDLGVIKILFLNSWRPFSIKARQAYFSSVTQGQIITIKRTGTFRLIDYYIRDVEKFNDEQIKQH